MEINDTNRACLAAIFSDLEGRPLRNLGQFSAAAELAEEAGLIAWHHASSPTAEDPGPVDSWVWQLTVEEIIILGAACDDSVREAKLILEETVEAVQLHGHGQASDDERQRALEAEHLDPEPRPIVVAPGPGPRVELVSPEWSGALCDGHQYD